MYSTKQKIDAENYKQYVKLLLKQYNGKYLVIFDTETTGKTQNDYIVQFAAKRYLIDNERLVFDAEIQEYIQPPVIMSEKATKINGLTNDFLSDKPEEEVIFPKIMQFLTEKIAILASYNAKFDEKMLYHAGTRNGFSIITGEKKDAIPLSRTFCFQSFDILTLCRSIILPEQVTDYRLESVVFYIKRKNKNYHDAMDDVENAFDVLIYLLSHIHDPVNKTATEKSIKIISFGYFSPSWRVKRLYLQGSKGEKLYYDIIKKNWYMNDKSDFMYNVAAIEAQCAKALGGTVEDFYKCTQKYVAVNE